MNFLNNPFFEKSWVKPFGAFILIFIFCFLGTFIPAIIFSTLRGIIYISLAFSFYIFIYSLIWFLFNKIFYFLKIRSTAFLTLIWIIIVIFSCSPFLEFFLRSLFIPKLNIIVFGFIFDLLSASNIVFFNTFVTWINTLKQSIIFLSFSLLIFSFIAFYVSTYYLSEKIFKHSIPFARSYEIYIFEKILRIKEKEEI